MKTNSTKHGTPLNFNADFEELVSRKALDALRLALSESGHFPTKPEPDWEEMCAGEVLASCGDQAGTAVRCLERLWLLPFRRFEACSALVVYYFSKFQVDQRALRKSLDGGALCDAFHVVVGMLLQGCANFPGEPHLVAEDLRRAIESASDNERSRVLPLARLFAAAADGRCGANRTVADHADEIALFERRARHGDFDAVVQSQHKMRSFEEQLAENPEFRSEWKTLLSDFGDVVRFDAGGIVRRSPLTERSGRRAPHPADASGQFQQAFDVFCWKWFLYGMMRDASGDHPLVQKVTCTFGPYGTTIFIPGYWSLDPHRDIKWSTVSRLHGARGVSRQGEKLDRNRSQASAQSRKAQAANVEAKAKGLRGEKRMAFIKQKAGLDQRTDDAQVRRLLRRKA